MRGLRRLCSPSPRAAGRGRGEGNGVFNSDLVSPACADSTLHAATARELRNRACRTPGAVLVNRIQSRTGTTASPTLAGSSPNFPASPAGFSFIYLP